MSLAPRSPVGIVTVNSLDFVRLVLASLEEGRIVVPLRSREDRVRKEIAGVTEVREPAPGHGWMSPRYRVDPARASEVAQFLFTSGTEGIPKGVELTHGALADVVDRLNGVMNVDASIREYVGVPVYHSFGFGRCRAVGAAGGRVFLPEHGFDPLELAEMLRRDEVNAVSAVPSLWRLVLDAPDLFASVGERVRWIEIGSQYMSRAEKEALRALFPAAAVVQHYGLTEASRSTFLEIHAAQGDALESVGRPCGAVEMKVSEEGRLMIRGPHVTARVWVEGEPVDPRDGDGWYQTNDLGSIRDGFVYFEGRADDVINCGGLKLAPEVLEQQVRVAVPNAGELAIARVPDPVRGDGILVALTQDAPELEARLLEATAAAAAAQGVNARGSIHVRVFPSLPTTASGKVQRRKLTEAFAPARASDPPPAAERRPELVEAPSARAAKEQELAAIWEQSLGISPIGLDESFYDLGGDSLTALNVIMRMGRAGVDPEICRQLFQGATIRDIARATVPVEAPTPAESPLLARERELAAIWEQALGVTPKVDESFYDLGGDSLTALNVIMRMSRAGIDPEICRQIFQGATIRDIARASVEVAEDETPVELEASPPESSMPNVGFRNNLIVNVLRGFLVASVVLGHWSIGFLERLPSVFSGLAPLLSPYFAFGTPGFAIVFGVGFGYLHLPNFEAHPGRLRKSVRIGATLVGAGVLLLCPLQIGRALSLGEPIDATTIAVSFFSPLLFYFLALLSMPLWFRVVTKLARGPWQMMVLFNLSVGSYVVFALCKAFLGRAPMVGAVELLRLMLVAKFGYFAMMSGVFAGLALGLYIRHGSESPTIARSTARIGAVVVLAALGIGAFLGELHILMTWPSELTFWKWMLYAGVIVLLLSGMFRLMRRYDALPPAARLAITGLATVGQLSLPFYVAHELVRPVKIVLELVGISGPIALLLALGGFAAVAWAMLRRVHGLFHA